MDPSFSNKQQFSFITCGRNCPLSKWKAHFIEAVHIVFQWHCQPLLAAKILTAMTGDPLLTQAHHVDMFARGEGNEALLMKTGVALFSSCNFIPAGLFSDWCKSDFFLLLGRVCVSLLNMAGQLAAWQPLQGFPLPSWPLDDEILAPSVLTCSVPSHQAPVMETVSVACWHLSVTHKSTIHTCPLADSPTHTEITPGSPTTSCLLVSDTHFPPLSCS